MTENHSDSDVGLSALLGDLGFSAEGDRFTKRSRYWGSQHHMRYAQISVKLGYGWGVNGLGIATPNSEQDIRDLVRIVLG